MPRLSNEITFGNLVSWSLIILGFVAWGFQLKAQADSTEVVALAAKQTADQAQRQIYSLQTDIAVIKSTTENIDRTVQEFKMKFILKQNQNGN